MQILRIEEASLSAWPALQHIFYDGWILRFANGYTKRANSINVLYRSDLDLLHKIGICETIYQDRNQSPIFRLTPLVPPDLDGHLEDRNYQYIDHTFVQYCGLSGIDKPSRKPYHFKSVDLDQWISLFVKMSGAKLADHETHRLMLKAIPARRLFATLEIDGHPVACGLGVQDREYMGLFDLVTDPAHRKSGFGTALVHEMMCWGKQHGADYAYLQVMESNTPALHLYSKLGFNTLYSYWYRVSHNT